jgi:hypothetical protein
MQHISIVICTVRSWLFLSHICFESITKRFLVQAASHGMRLCMAMLRLGGEILPLFVRNTAVTEALCRSSVQMLSCFQPIESIPQLRQPRAAIKSCRCRSAPPQLLYRISGSWLFPQPTRAGAANVPLALTHRSPFTLSNVPIISII